jgi:hypothetical protein
MIYGYVNQDRYTMTVEGVDLSLPLKWRPILWIISILQHQAVYHAGNGSHGHIFTSLVWFYDGLLQHLKEEASKHPFMADDWSLPVWDRFLVRLRLEIGHSPLDLYTFTEQLAEAYVHQPIVWSQGLLIIMYSLEVQWSYGLIGLHQTVEKNSLGWKSALLTVALQHFQDGLPTGTPTILEWVDMQYTMLLNDLQPGYGSNPLQGRRRLHLTQPLSMLK